MTTNDSGRIALKEKIQSMLASVGAGKPLPSAIPPTSTVTPAASNSARASVSSVSSVTRGNPGYIHSTDSGFFQRRGSADNPCPSDSSAYDDVDEHFQDSSSEGETEDSSSYSIISLQRQKRQARPSLIPKVVPLGRNTVPAFAKLNHPVPDHSPALSHHPDEREANETFPRLSNSRLSEKSNMDLTYFDEESVTPVNESLKSHSSYVHQPFDFGDSGVALNVNMRRNSSDKNVCSFAYPSMAGAQPAAPPAVLHSIHYSQPQHQHSMYKVNARTFVPKAHHLSGAALSSSQNNGQSNVSRHSQDSQPQKAREERPHCMLNGKMYLVLNQLGSGGSSTVYLVFDEEDKTCKALKVVRLDDPDESVRQAYLNEIARLNQCKNAHRVVQLFDHAFTNDPPRVLLLLEKGDTDLAALFKSRKEQDKFTDKLISFYWLEMLQAVQEIHKLGIIHSDLKPGNFLIVEGNLKIIDFGIADALPGNRTSVTKVQQMGTVNYMSPEAVQIALQGGGSPDQCEGLREKYRISTKSDVWSLGCILYNMVYGKTPFQDIKGSYLYKLTAIVADTPLSFPALDRNGHPVNKYLLDVMQRCLTRNPKQRPSIDDLLRHPYVVAEQSGATTKKSLSDDKIRSLVSSLSQNSPRTAANMLKKVLQEVQSGDVGVQ